MIISFKIENFLSFRDSVEFSMVAKSYQKKQNHVHNCPNINILKLSAIYGSNASGKSNFVKALKFLKEIICNKKRSLETFKNMKFKIGDNNKKDTSFKIVYKATDDLIYQYSISFNLKSIKKESLYYFEGKKKKLVFSRILEKNEKYRLDIPENQVNSEEDKIRLQVYQEVLTSGRPLLSIADTVSNLIDFTEAYYWFEEQLEFLFPHFSDNGTFLRLYITDLKFRHKAKEIILNTNGLGITDIKLNEVNVNDFFGASETERKLNYLSKLEDVPFIFFEQEGKEHIIIEGNDGVVNVTSLKFQHSSEKDTYVFELNEESDGTRRLFHLLPSIIDSIDKSKVYIIDEIDRSMHPILIKDLLKLYTKKFQNDSGQMIFTTHESYLMDLNLLRQDEFWFVEKNQKTGSTEMYSLIEFKPRFDLNIRNGYLNGKFGAIPFLSEPNW